MRTMYVKNSQGFSLTEILICTVIIGITAQFLSYSIASNASATRLYGAAEQVLWDLQSARTQAIKRSQNVLVAFVNDHQYAIGPDTNNNAVLDVGEGAIKDIQKKHHSVRFATPLPPTLVFSPGGTPNTTMNIVLKSSNNLKNIVVSTTGKAKVS